MRTASWLLFSALIVSCLSLSSCGSSSDDVTLGDTSDDEGTVGSDDPTPSASNKIWTVSEVLSESRSGGSGGTPKCGGEGGFARCLCAGDVPATVRYRPAVVECNGNAAAIFDGSYQDIFSVVVRDSQNRDRWPPSGFNGCSAEVASSEDPPKSCSAFKVQSMFVAGGGSVTFHCFGASGYSSLFEDVTRITVKLSDVPTSNDDPLERFCLNAPNLPLN